MHDLKEYTPEMPDKEKDGKVCRYIYFPSDDVKAKVLSIAAKKGFQTENGYICYQVIKGPPMVSDREFVILKSTIDNSAASKSYFIAQRSVEVTD